MQDKTIVVVDDDADFLDMVCLVLKKLSVQVVRATTAVDCLKQMQMQHVDMVVTDISMPDMNGLQLTKKIRSIDRYSQIPIMLMTGGGTAINFQDYQFKADGICLKQQLQNTFLSCVSSMLAADA